METVKSAELKPEKIDAVVTNGGSFCIPAFQRMLERLFGRNRVISANVFSSATAGLAIQAGKSASQGEKVKL